MPAAGPTAKPPALIARSAARVPSRGKPFRAAAAAASTHSPSPTARPTEICRPASPRRCNRRTGGGPQPVTNLVDCDREKMEVGAAVEVRLEAIDVSLPALTHST